MKNLGKNKLFNSPYVWEDTAGSYIFTSNLKIIKYNLLMQLWICWCRASFYPFFLVRSYKILPVPAQNYLKKIHFFISSKNKNIWKIWQEVSSLTTLSLKIAGSYSFTSNLKIIWWKTDIGSFRNSFGSSFVNWEVTRPHKFLIKVIWNIVFQ